MSQQDPQFVTPGPPTSRHQPEHGERQTTGRKADSGPSPAADRKRQKKSLDPVGAPGLHLAQAAEGEVTASMTVSWRKGARVTLEKEATSPP